MKPIKLVAVILLLMLGVTSCHLDEPNEDAGAESKLVSVTGPLGVPLCKITYDSQQRPTSIYRGDEEYNISYDPMKVVVKEYDLGQVIEVDTWENILIRDGRIVSFTNTESDIRNPSNNCVTHVDVTYDSEGRITRIKDDGTMIFTWSDDGNLISIVEDDGHSEFTYGTLPNATGQWSVNWAFNPLAIFGYFGKAPVRFPASLTDYTETLYFAYRLDKIQRIDVEQVKTSYGEDDAETVSFKYNYR